MANQNTPPEAAAQQTTANAAPAEAPTAKPDRPARKVVFFKSFEVEPGFTARRNECHLIDGKKADELVHAKIVRNAREDELTEAQKKKAMVAGEGSARGTLEA